MGGIGASFATIIAATIAVVVYFQDSESPSTPQSAIFLGKVIDQNDNGVESATVYALNQVHGDTVGFGQTDVGGDFNFTVKLKPENSVYILIEKDGKTHPHGFETLAGNMDVLSSLDFAIRV